MSPIPRKLRHRLPFIDLMTHYRTARRDGLISRAERNRRFRSLIESGRGKRCMQVGVRGHRFDTHWIVVDLADPSPLVDFRMDVQNLDFDNDEFDIVVCNAVLEHVEDPASAISELHRVLKPGGEVWVEIPFVQAQHYSREEGWFDYWRVSLTGLRIWMRDFEEISSDVFGTPIWNGGYFHGHKIPDPTAAHSR